MGVLEAEQHGWSLRTPRADFTAVLFIFAWTLLPFGFQGMMLLFQRYESFRFPLMAVSQTLLVLTMLMGIAQRKAAYLDRQIQLALFVICGALGFILLCWQLGLDDYWWLCSAVGIGSIPYAFVSLSSLASYNEPWLELPWDPSHTAPLMQAMPHWRIVSARWTRSVMAMTRLENQAVAILRGVLDGDECRLRIEVLSRIQEDDNPVPLGIQWGLMVPPQSVKSESE